MRVVRPALAELVALGLIEHERGRKYSAFTMSERWREIDDAQEAHRIAGVARESCPALVSLGRVEAAKHSQHAHHQPQQPRTTRWRRALTSPTCIRLMTLPRQPQDPSPAIGVYPPCGQNNAALPELSARS